MSVYVTVFLMFFVAISFSMNNLEILDFISCVIRNFRVEIIIIIFQNT